MKKDHPTHTEMKITGSGDMENHRDRWVQLLQDYSQFKVNNFVHPLFGPMTLDQIGYFVFKPNDHQLLQLGVYK